MSIDHAAPRDAEFRTVALGNSVDAKLEDLTTTFLGDNPSEQTRGLASAETQS
jgi:hypothetical protein